MILSFSRKRITFNTLIGIAWFAIAIASYYRILQTEKWYIYGALALGAIHIGIVLFESINKYIEFTPTAIKNKSIFKKHIRIDDIKRIGKSDAGYVILDQNGTELQIRKSNVRKDQIPALDQKMEEIQRNLS